MSEVKVAENPEMDLFGAAETVKSPVAVKSSSTAFVVGDTLDIIGSIDTIMDSFQGVRDFYQNELKAEVRPEYIRRGLKFGGQPDNLDLEAPLGTTCSAQWRKRSASSVLTKEEIKVLDENKISHTTVTTQPAIEERFFINPEVLSDPALRAAISAALKNVPELAGKQVIMKQPAVAKVTKEVVSETTISEIFKLGSEEKAGTLLKSFSVFAPKVKGLGNVEEAFKILEKAGLNELINKAKSAKK